MRRQSREAKGRESGQMMVLLVLLFVAALGLTALVIDVGIFLVEKRDIQNTADAAALAGAQELPSSPLAVAAAVEWAEKNGFVDGVEGTTVQVVTPYNGDPWSIQVTVTSQESFMFGRVLGKELVTVQARAVAGRETSAGYAVFGADQSCGSRSVEFTGGSFAVYGNVHSNGRIKMTGGSVFVDGTVSYVCSAQTGGGSQVFTGGLVQVSEPIDWPVYFEYSNFGPCTFQSDGNIHIKTSTPEYWMNDDPSTGILKTGLYCAEGNIQLSGTSFSGHVTFVAHGNIHFSSSSLDFQPYVNNVVAFSDHGSGSAIQVSASSLTWEGLLMATQGEIDMSGSTASTPGGGLYANRVDLSGGSYSIVADEPVAIGPPRLME
ncbi:MAG: pilus assembly protein TadG-related protein [Anaerolineae bacterium]